MQYRYAVMHAGTLGIQNSKADSLSVPEELGLHSDTNTIQHISDTLSLKKKKLGTVVCIYTSGAPMERQGAGTTESPETYRPALLANIAINNKRFLDFKYRNIQKNLQHLYSRND